MEERAMSGEKCAEVSLDREIEQQIHALLEARQLRVAGSQAVRDATQILAVVAADVKRLMPAEWEECEHAQAALTARSTRAAAALAAAEKIGQVTRDNQSAALSTAGKARAEGEAYEREASQFRTRVQEVADLRIKKMDLEAREAIVQRLKRERVSGLRARIETDSKRLKATDAARMNALAQRLAALQAAERLDDRAIEVCEAELSALAKEARETERLNTERWEIGKRLVDAFRSAGYKEDTGTPRPPTGRGRPVHWNLSLKGRSIDSMTEVDVPEDKTVKLIMRGRAGRKEVEMAPACDTDLKDIIASARELGMVIEKVLWVNPDGGSREIYADKPVASRRTGETNKQKLVEVAKAPTSRRGR
jgi:hypothetical protein